MSLLEVGGAGSRLSGSENVGDGSLALPGRAGGVEGNWSFDGAVSGSGVGVDGTSVSDRLMAFNRL